MKHIDERWESVPDMQRTDGHWAGTRWKMNTCGTRRIASYTKMSNSSTKSETQQHMEANMCDKAKVSLYLVHSLMKDIDEGWESLPNV